LLVLNIFDKEVVGKFRLAPLYFLGISL